MGNAGFLEDFADGNVAAFPIKALGVELRMENGFTEVTCSRGCHQIFQNAPADARAATFSQHRHSADFDRIAVRDHPSASHRHAAGNREHVKSLSSILIKFELFGNTLFIDEDLAPDGPCLVHRGFVANFDDSDVGGCGHCFA